MQVIGGPSDATLTAGVAAGPAPAEILANANASFAAGTSGGAPATAAPHEIQATAKVIQPSYTVQSGDTLGQIAGRFGTTVDRIQALNNLADPRALRIGTKLIVWCRRAGTLGQFSPSQ